MRSIFLFCIIISTSLGCLSTEASFADQLFKVIAQRDGDRLQELMLPAGDQIKLNSWPDSHESRYLLDSLRQMMVDEIILQADQKDIDKAELVNYSVTGDQLLCDMTLRFEQSNRLDSLKLSIFRPEHRYFLFGPAED